MAREFTFRSPGFFEREIDLAQRVQGPIGTPAAIIGTAQKGPAFVPVTVGSFVDFRTKFGDLDPEKAGPYAVNEFLRNRTALTYMRVLGAGANDTAEQIEKTRATGQVNNAGFIVTGTIAQHSLGHVGSVQFLAAVHDIQANELLGMPIFTDNDSYGTGLGAGADVKLIRAAIFCADDTRLFVLNGNQAVTAGVGSVDDVATIDPTITNGTFKLVISSSDTTYDTADGLPGLRVLSASLNPDNANYISKILNTDPQRFGVEKHMLYLDFAVDDQIATTAPAGGTQLVAVISGSSGTSATSGDASMIFRDVYGHYDTRYTTPRTPWIISQPYGKTEHPLFYFESLDDGDYANTRYKVSISQVRKSDDPKSNWGTFSVLVRAWGDVDQDPQIIEQFSDVTLNPKADNYIAKIIGDKKVRYDFDADSEEEKRLIIEGKFPNRSNIIRVVMTRDVDKMMLPDTILPFGFKGISVLKTNDAGTDEPTDSNNIRLAGNIPAGPAQALTGAIVPPLPFRFKVTRGNTSSALFAGSPGATEIVDSRLYWGTKFERNTAPLNPNVTQEKNTLLWAYSKFQGLEKLDAVITGSQLDTFNENKFTLARVAFGNTSLNDLTGTVNQHIREAAYIRNAEPDVTEYKVSDGVLTNRLTFASLVAMTSSITYNRFTDFAKFTVPFVGGFDGLNILDKHSSLLHDKSTSTDVGGAAESTYIPDGLAINPAGFGRTNNAIFSYNEAVKIITDEMTTNANILAIPGIRDSFVTDNAAQRAKENSMMMYVMDVVPIDHTDTRIFDDSSNRPDVRRTITNFATRQLDNNYVATYFPDVRIDDTTNNRRVKVPASVAALAALSFNDSVAYPWFAPAGFNRGALEFVRGLDVRLDSEDRNLLQDARINPIASFPREGIAIFGQKTLQFAKSALDRVNVRRLMLEVKRQVIDVARRIVFEQNNAATRGRFVSQITPLLGLIQAQAGIEGFKVICDESNNTQVDVDANKLNGKIIVIPTRAVEFIAIDFIITPSGVEFTA